MAARKRTKSKKSKNEKPISLFPMSIDEALRMALGAVPPEELNAEKVIEIIKEVARKKKDEGKE